MEYILEEIPITNFKIGEIGLDGVEEKQLLTLENKILCKVEIEENKGEILFLSDEVEEIGSFIGVLNYTYNQKSFDGIGRFSLVKIGEKGEWRILKTGTWKQATLYKLSLELTFGGERKFYTVGTVRTNIKNLPGTIKTPPIPKYYVSTTDLKNGVIPRGLDTNIAILTWEAYRGMDISIGYKRIVYGEEPGTSGEYNAIIDLENGEILYTNASTREFKISYCNGAFPEGVEINVIENIDFGGGVLFLSKQEYLKKINLNYNNKIKIEE